MKTTPLTITRNKRITGNNSKSYNDKHPENPISLRPIRDACKAIYKSSPYVTRAQKAYNFHACTKLRRLKNFSGPAIARGISNLALS